MLFRSKRLTKANRKSMAAMLYGAKVIDAAEARKYGYEPKGSKKPKAAKKSAKKGAKKK